MVICNLYPESFTAVVFWCSLQDARSHAELFSPQVLARCVAVGTAESRMIHGVSLWLCQYIAIENGHRNSEISHF